MRANWRRRRFDDRGATVVEYALLAGFIATVIAIAVMALGETSLGQYERSTHCFEPAESQSDACLGVH